MAATPVAIRRAMQNAPHRRGVPGGGRSRSLRYSGAMSALSAAYSLSRL